MKQLKTLLIAAAGIASAAFVIPAWATPCMTVTDTITSVTVCDGGPGDLTPAGDGAVLMSAAMGVWTFNIAGGQTSPPLPGPPPALDMVSAATSTGAGTLIISWTDYGFAGPLGIAHAAVGGTLGTGASATFETYYDALNTGAWATLCSSMSFSAPPTAFSGAEDCSLGNLPGIYSITQVATYTNTTAAGNSFDYSFKAVPEPATPLLVGLGLLVAGFASRRRASR